MYRLIAFDMDGTLLDSRKTISKENLAAIHEARLAGKDVAVCTGRPVTELLPYEKDFSDIRYLVTACGALLYDRVEHRILKRHTLDSAITPALLSAIAQEDIMPQALIGGASYVQKDDLSRMDHYHMGIYTSLYAQCATPVDDMAAFLQEHSGEFEKVNLYHATTEGRERTRKRLSLLPVDLTNAEASSLEVSIPGVTKGSGLLDLAKALGIPKEQVIGVGDADNDIPMLKDAGLGLCMGNGEDRAKEAADEVLPTNDENGCAFAIRKYLLSE